MTQRETASNNTTALCYPLVMYWHRPTHVSGAEFHILLLLLLLLLLVCRRRRRRRRLQDFVAMTLKVADSAKVVAEIEDVKVQRSPRNPRFFLKGGGGAGS
jgi:hypothetical protein